MASGLKVVTVLLKVMGLGGDGPRGPSSRSLGGPMWPPQSRGETWDLLWPLALGLRLQHPGCLVFGAWRAWGRPGAPAARLPRPWILTCLPGSGLLPYVELGPLQMLRWNIPLCVMLLSLMETLTSHFPPLNLSTLKVGR